jgi:hypothetical protein
MFNIIENLNNFYEIYRNPKYKITDWTIVNNKIYELYYNKINITNGELKIKDVELDVYGKLLHSKQATALLETKNKYILIKYNPNFIAIIVSDTEYGLTINPVSLIGIQNSKNLETNTDLPKLSKVLKVLGWKITRKATNNIKYSNNYY